MILCKTERASSVRQLRLPRITTPQLCHDRPVSQTSSSSAEFCASSSGPLRCSFSSTAVGERALALCPGSRDCSRVC